MSLSPVVSTNKKEETNKVGEVTGETLWRKSITHGIGGTSTEATTKSGDNISKNVLKATKGLNTRAVNNLEIGGGWSRLFFLFFDVETYSGAIDGDVIAVKK
jgi:hypothetical protein